MKDSKKNILKIKKSKVVQKMGKFGIFCKKYKN